MIGLLFRAAPARLRAAPALGALPVLVIALGAGAVLSVDLLNRAALGTLDASLEALSGGAELVISGLREEEGSIPDEAWPEALAVPGVESAAPAVRLAGWRVAAGSGEAGIEVEAGTPVEARVPIWGVEILSGGFDFAGPGAKDSPAGEGARFSPDLFFAGGVVLPQRVADRLGVEVGDAVRLVRPRPSAARPAGESPVAVDGERRVAGISPADGAGAPAFLDLAAAQALRGGDGLDRIEIAVASGFEVESVRRALAARLPGAQVEERGTLRREGAELFAAFRLNLLALSTVSLLVAAFLVYASVRAALAARRQEVGLYRVLGASAPRVGALLFGEVLLTALAGAALGIPVGALAAEASLDRVSATITNFYLLERIESVTLAPAAVVTAVFVALLAALAGAAPEVFREARRPPAALLAPGRAPAAAARSRRPGVQAGLLGVALVGFAVWPLLAPESWPARFGGGFGAAAALLVGVALLPGAVLRLASGFHRGQGSAVGRGVLAALREPGSTGPPAAALVVAVATVAGVSSLIGSFRATLDGWLAETLAADLYVSRTGGPGRIAAERNALSSESLAILASDPDVRNRDLLRVLRVRLEGRPVSVLGVDAALPEAGERFAFIGDRGRALAGFRAGEALVSEPLARRLGLGPGGRLALPATGAAAAEVRAVRIAGVYRDYGNETGALFLDRGLLNRLYPPAPGAVAPVHGAALYLRPGTDRSAAAARLSAALGNRANVVENASLRARALEVFDQTMAVTGLLRGFAIGIAGLGMALFLWTLVRERQPEAALERALGASRTQVAFGFFGRALVIVALALLLGGGAGAVLTLLLVRVVNPVWFGWSLDLHWPAAALLAQAALVLATGLLAAAVPARLASRVEALALRQEI